MKLRPDIQAVILDLDGTLYKFPDNKDELFQIAVAQSSMELGFNGSYEDALAIAQDSGREYGSEQTLFVKEHGLNKRDLFVRAHEVGSHLFTQALKPDAKISQAIKTLAENRDIAILTHSADNWARRLLNHLQIAPEIKTDRILALDHPEIDFRTKGDFAEVFEIACGKMGVAPETCAIFEDSVNNLRHPHDMGMQAVYVNWGNAIEHDDFEIDQISSVAELRL